MDIIIKRLKKLETTKYKIGKGTPPLTVVHHSLIREGIDQAIAIVEARKKELDTQERGLVKTMADQARKNREGYAG